MRSARAWTAQTSWTSITQIATERADRPFVAFRFERIEYMPRAGRDYEFVTLFTSLEGGGKLECVCGIHARIVAAVHDEQGRSDPVGPADGRTSLDKCGAVGQIAVINMAANWRDIER
jgi:hypothetical protein